VEYARIRYTDSDWVRTSRQREVLSGLFTSFKDTNVISKTKMIQSGLSLVKTNMSAKEITSLGIDTLPRMSGEILSMHIPEEGYYRVNRSPIWYMVVDYNRVIPELYKFIFGKEQAFDPVPTIPFFEPTSTPLPTPTKSVSTSVSPWITIQPTPTNTPTLDPNLSPTIEVTPDTTLTPIVSPTDTPPTATPTSTPTITAPTP